MDAPRLETDQQRVLDTLLAMQRQSWEQGVASHALLDLGLTRLVEVVVHDAVTHQTPSGKLADLDERGAVNCGSVVEALLSLVRRDGGRRWTEAYARQLRWLLEDCPRAADGTLFHLDDVPECWVDSVYMVVPALVAAGELDEAARQLDGHRRRLFDADAGLYGWRWDEAAGRMTHPQHWGTGNGWVVAGIARTLRLLPDRRSPFAREVAEHARTVLDACLAHRREDGLFHDVVDDPSSFAEVNLAQMLGYGVLTGLADGWLPAGYEEVGRSLLRTARAHVDERGLVTPACGAPHFDRPGTSAEAQAFFLLATAADRPPSPTLPT